MSIVRHDGVDGCEVKVLTCLAREEHLEEIFKRFMQTPMGNCYNWRWKSKSRILIGVWSTGLW